MLHDDRGTDIVLPDDLEHIRARRANDARNAAGAVGKNRKNHVLDAVPAGGWQQPPFERKLDDENQREPEARHGEEDKREDARNIINQLRNLLLLDLKINNISIMILMARQWQ